MWNTFRNKMGKLVPRSKFPVMFVVKRIRSFRNDRLKFHRLKAATKCPYKIDEWHPRTTLVPRCTRASSCCFLSPLRPSRRSRRNDPCFPRSNTSSWGEWKRDASTNRRGKMWQVWSKMQIRRNRFGAKIRIRRGWQVAWLARIHQRFRPLHEHTASTLCRNTNFITSSCVNAIDAKLIYIYESIPSVSK